MPVQTRAQSRQKQQEKPTATISIGLIHKPTVPLARTKVNLPTEIYNKYPLDYRGFWIANESQKSKVNNFYDELSKPWPESPIANYFKNNTYEIKNIPILKYDIPTLKGLLDSFYSIDKMWNDYEQVANGILSTPQTHTIDDLKPFALWNTCMRKYYNALIHLIIIDMDNTKSTPGSLSGMVEKAKKVKIMYEYINSVDKIHTCEHIGVANKRYRNAYIKKLLELTRIEGLEYALYAFAHYYPEMVSEDCYPVINRSAQLYHSNDIAIRSTDNPMWQSLRDKYINIYLDRRVSPR